MPDFGIYAGDTSKTVYVRLRDSTTGLAKTGLVFNSTGAVASYTLPGAARAAITLATLASASAAWATGGFILVDDTNAKGLYRLDLPNAAIASGDYTVISIEFDGIIEESMVIPLHDREVDVVKWNGTAVGTPDTAGYPVVTVKDGTGQGEIATTSGAVDTVTTATTATSVTNDVGVNEWNGVALGTTNPLPNAAAGGAGGIPLSTAGSLEMDTLADWVNGGRLDLIIDAILADVTGLNGDVMRGTDGAYTGTPPTADAISNAVWDEALEDHDTNGQAGWAQMLAAYSGPRGPGVYFDDAAANTGQVNGTDGTPTNPISGATAVKAVADSIGTKRIYVVNDSLLTLNASMADYEIVGIGAPTPTTGNRLALASQALDGAAIFNLNITGVQAGTTRALFEDCTFGTATLHLHARRCGFTDAATGVTFSNNDDNILEGCYSMVAGNSAPIFICSGANLDLSVRHYSGGIEIASSNATATISIESMGQVIFAATCSTSTPVTMRGLQTITDNTGGMAALTEGARIDRDAINAEVVDVLETDTSAELSAVPAASSTIGDMIRWLFLLARNKRTTTSTTDTLRNDADGADIGSSTISDSAGTFTRGEYS